MQTSSIRPIADGVCRPGESGLLMLERTTAKEAAYAHRVVGVDVALDELSTGFGETIFVNPLTGQAV